MKRIFIFLLFILSIFDAFSQSLKGVIFDEKSNAKVSQTKVFLVGKDTLSVTSDPYGAYEFKQIPVGRYRLFISKEGYNSFFINELEFQNKIDIVQDIPLSTEKIIDCPVVTVVESSSRFSALQNQEFLSMEKTKRFPAMFNDPVRLAMTKAGVANDNDQANGLSIHGFAPSAMQWRLEGTEILNPNHLSNAGTFSDRATSNSGGVNALSMQVLGTSTLVTGAFSGEMNDAISGVMDMKMKKGDFAKRHYSAQIGLIGVEASAEGAFRKNREASYVVNYRYSALGLLTKMGVPLGDEQINFQDLSFNLNLPISYRHKFNVFGVVGASENIFKRKTDSSEIKTEKDLKDISFENKLNIYGVHYKGIIGEKFTFESSLAYSTTNSQRLEIFKNKTTPDSNFQKLWSSNSFLSMNISRKWDARIGLLVKSRYKFFTPSNALAPNNTDNFSTTPYAELSWRIFKNLVAQGSYFIAKRGSNGANYTYGLPSGTLRWTVNAKNTLTGSLGLRVNDEVAYDFFGILSSINLDYAHKFENAKFHINVYGTAFAANTKTNLTTKLVNSYETNQLGETFLEKTPRPVVNTRGIDVGFERYFSQNYFINATSSIVNSTLLTTGKNYSTFYDKGFVNNVAFGKEWTSRKHGDRFLGFSISAVYRKGFNAFPIDLTGSSTKNTTVYTIENGLTERLPDYFRSDLRLYRTVNKKRYSATLSLDIQNVTNNQNIGFNYYDTYLKKVNSTVQNGLIPILSWRILL
jgi:hypothetical protein